MKEENKKINPEETEKIEKENETLKNGSENIEEADENSLRVTELEKEVAELKDKYLRKIAEFENYKRRTENDQMNLIKYSAASFIVKILPVVDDFERSLEHIEELPEEFSAMKTGLKLVYDKLKKVLDDEGVKKIESVGKPFDVHFHEAIMQRKDDSVEAHTVLDEVEKGYLYKDKVIRHSKVIVSEESNEESFEENKNNFNSDEESGK